MHFFRAYDPAIRKFMHIDPKPTFGISNYASRANNPMMYSDFLGDSIKIDIIPGGGRNGSDKYNLTP